MKKLTLITSLLLFLAGCSLQPIRLIKIESSSIKGRNDIPILDPNNGPYSIKSQNHNSNKPFLSWEINESIQQDKPSKTKYQWWYHLIGKFLVTEGRIGKNWKKYPVILDTGATEEVVVINDIHVRENKLPVYPLGDNYGGFGMCHLPKLRIGNTSLQNFRCLYHGTHVDLQLFGITISRDEAIIIGLPAMKKFKYILANGTKKEVELSLTKTFEPKNPELWSNFPLKIELVPEKGSSFLFVTIPIAGQETELMVDTGGGNALLISQSLWKNLSREIEANLKESTTFAPGHKEPLVSSKTDILKKIKIGNRTLKKASITVLPDDSSPIKGYKGLLGMPCFKNTIMVLDFERNLMWVKK